MKFAMSSSWRTVREALINLLVCVPVICITLVFFAVDYSNGDVSRTPVPEEKFEVDGYSIARARVFSESGPEDALAEIRANLQGRSDYPEPLSSEAPGEKIEKLHALEDRLRSAIGVNRDVDLAERLGGIEVPYRGCISFEDRIKAVQERIETSGVSHEPVTPEEARITEERFMERLYRYVLAEKENFGEMSATEKDEFAGLICVVLRDRIVKSASPWLLDLELSQKFISLVLEELEQLLPSRD